MNGGVWIKQSDGTKVAGTVKDGATKPAPKPAAPPAPKEN